ncbi:MAG TPA: hypothetical protein VFP54_00490 [Acidimicrobiales bacterium]|nr:hypothetical protein [Acidimicrobiales bacterium]
MSRRRRQVKWVIGGLSVALIVSGATVVSGGGTARAAGVTGAAGQGTASAQAVQVTPHEGSLAVGAIFGEALAGNTGDYARAQSQGLDLGAVGTSMKSYNCGQPPQPAIASAVPSPLEVETGQNGASSGVTDTNPQQTYGATEFGKANGVPYAEADTTYMPLNGGAFTVTGTHSKAWSGLVKGVQDDGASVDISSVSIANGAVVLNGLHWHVDYPLSGAPSGAFTVGQATVAGQSVPTNDMSALGTAVNAVLSPLGMQLQLPQVSDIEGVEHVTPLQLQVVPSSNRDTVIDGVLNATAPAYNSAANGLEGGFGSWEPSQLEQALCQSDTPITVADITLASIDGAGFFTAAFGGVDSTASALQANSYNLGLTNFSLGTPGSSQFVAGPAGGSPAPSGAGLTAGSSGLGSSSPLPASSSPASASPASAPSKPASSSEQSMTPASAGFSPGGPLLALGLAGLAALLVLAEADRRMIKHTYARQAFEE